MFKQTDPKYKSIMLGNGTGSIFDYGCYLVSLCNGLNLKGYNFTPEGLNQTLKDKGLWIGPTSNYIDIGNIASKWPDVFQFFDRIDPWGSEPLTDTLINDQLVVLGRVSATPIGGSGNHFVLIKGVKNGVAIIYDPWSGVEEPITTRWSSFGYILGLYIFKVKPVVAPVVVPITDQTKIPQIVDSNGNAMEVQAIKSNLNDQGNTIISLKMTVTSLNTQITTLNTQIVDLQDQIKQLQNQKPPMASPDPSGSVPTPTTTTDSSPKKSPSLYALFKEFFDSLKRG